MLRDPVRRDLPRRHGVDRHSVARHLARERLEVADRRHPVRVRERQVRDRLDRRARPHIHDPPPALLPHRRQHRLDQGARREDELAIRALPLVRRALERAARRRPARVRHQDLDACRRARRRPARKRGEPLQVGRIGLERRRLAVDLRRGLVQALERAARHRHLRPLASERPGDPAADPLARAHDERDTASIPRSIWAVPGSNRRPSRCKRDALPTELTARRKFYRDQLSRLTCEPPTIASEPSSKRTHALLPPS